MTSLATQLQKLQQRSTESKHLSDSFLFNKSDAKSFSREQVWQLASNGLQTLVTIDNAFHPFIEELFDMKKARQERRLLTNEESNKLNLRIEHFLTLLSPHLFLTAAHQVFEYLVRVHEVHVYNVNAVLRAFLPYHDHNLFSRAILLLDLRDTGLDFLSKNQERGAPLPREQLIIAAAESRQVLRMVCDTAALPLRLGIANNAANALFTSVTARLAQHAEADSLWRTLLPYIMEFLNGADSTETVRDEVTRFNGVSSVVKETACSALVVLAAWSAEVQFSLKTVLAVIKPLMSFLQQAQEPLTAVASLPDLLGMMEIIFHTQHDVVSQVSFTPQLGILCTLPWSSWAPLLEAQFDLSGSSGSVPFNSLFSTLVLFGLDRIKVADSFSSISGDIIQMLQVAATSLPLSQPVVQEFLKVFMTSEDKFQEGKDSSHRFFSTVVSALERRYQFTFDATLSSLLVENGSHASSFLSRHLNGTRYQMVSVRGGREKLPLFACLIHANPEVRRVGAAAVKEMTLDQLVSSSSKKNSGSGGADGNSLVELLAIVLSYESQSNVANDMSLAAFHALSLLADAYKTAKESQKSTRAEYHHYFRLLLDSLCQLSFVQTRGEFLSFLFKEILVPLFHKTAEGEEGLLNTVFYHITVLYVSSASLLDTLDKELPEGIAYAKLVNDITSFLKKSFQSIPTLPQLFGQNTVPTGSQDKPSTVEEDSDEEEELRASQKKKATTKKDTVKKGQSTADAGNALVDVFTCQELLRKVYPEATRRSTAVLRSMKTVLMDPLAPKSQYDRASAEALVCSAAGLFEEPTVYCNTLLEFLLGGAGELTPSTSGDAATDGYLSLLQLKRHTESQVKQTQLEVGRGATSNSAGYSVPSDSLTARLGVVVSRAVTYLLRSLESTPWLATALKLHGYLLTEVPPLTTNLELLPSALLELLTWSRDSATVDWFSLVHSSVFNAAASPLGVSDTTATVGALSVPLLLPLYASEKKRRSIVENLQSTILAAQSGGGDDKSPCSIIMRSAFSKNGLSLSLTTLNSIVESLAREESRFTITPTAAELICRMLALEGVQGYVVPAATASLVLQYFFPLPSVDTWTIKSGQAQLPVGVVLPRVRHITSQSLVSEGSAEFVQDVASRGIIRPAAAPASDPTVQLCELLIRCSHLRVTSSSVTIPVFRYALTILAHTLQCGEVMSSISAEGAPLIFSTKGKKSGGAKKKVTEGEDTLSEDFIVRLAGFIAPTIALGVRKIGPEVASFCVGTNGGYYRITRPFLFAPESVKSDTDVVIEVLQELVPSSRAANPSAWQPPTSCIVSNPLTNEDAMTLLHCGLGKDGVFHWDLSVESVNRLRLLTALLHTSPTIRFDDDEDEQSLYHFVISILSSYPIDKMSALLSLNEGSDELEKDLERAEILRGWSRLSLLEGGNRLLSTLARHVLTFIQTFVTVYNESGPVLNEKKNDGATVVRTTLLKQGLVLMATLLLQEETTVEEEVAAGEVPATDSMKEKINVISELLRVLAPLLSSRSNEAKSRKEDEVVEEDVLRQKDFYLHIPIVALLVRLEPFELSDALHFKTAAEVCQDILNSFDIHTQIQCISQLMRLVCDPEAQLAKEQQLAGEDIELVKLFRRLVKPNQIINRQENVLNLINSTVKSDQFLGPFIALQHKTSRSDRTSKKKSTQVEGEEEEEDVVADGSRTDSVCMGLIINALEFFSHFSDLNLKTENDVELGGDRSGEEELGEQKSYTMLLELLAGNALACVLAGINEPTFVHCLERLLQDPRANVQLKGLEVLVDRVHHSLPTVENTMTDEELEQHRRDLRDPKKKLTLMDLIHVKARPLTTKRSFTLYPILVRLHEFCQNSTLQEMTSNHHQQHSTLPQKAKVQLLFMAQLCVAAMEELVRIVGSGGSTQAEKTLLNVNRSKKVTEATLIKLFGNKSRVREVHHSAVVMCEQRIPKLMQTAYKVLHPSETGHTTLQDRRQLEEYLLANMASCYTFIGTVTQVLGFSFVLEHCTTILKAIVSGAVYEVLDLPPLVSQGEAGSLLRHATLSAFIRCFPLCWHMSQPYLAPILFSATHLININDTETFYLCQEVLTVLEALLEPQIFIDACTECFKGISYEGNLKTRTIRIKSNTHSFDHFFGCVGRRVQSLKKEELVHMPVLTEGTTPQNNFWLAVFQTLASAVAVPSTEVVSPVLNAYTIFFLKFKPKQCNLLLTHVAEWAFGGDSDSFIRQIKKQKEGSDSEDEEEEGRHTEVSSKTALHRWILFFALYNSLLDKLESILEFSFALATVYIVPVLANHCSSSKTQKTNNSLIALVLEGALDSVRRMALAHTPGPDADPSIPVTVYFATTEVFNSIMPALVHQLTNTVYLTDSSLSYYYRAVKAVVPAVRAFFACLNSNKLQSKTQAEIARGMRHPSAEVRQVTIQCFDAIYADGGEELAARLMAEILPGVVELTEDRNDDVVEETRKFCTNLSHMTGQDVLHAMS